MWYELGSDVTICFKKLKLLKKCGISSRNPDLTYIEIIKERERERERFEYYESLDNKTNFLSKF